LKILICFGTRPEAIKLAPVIYELKKRGLKFQVCITGQHREMLDQVLQFFQIKPDYDLGLMKKNQSLNGLGAEILQAIDKILLKEKPDLVLVHGDTSTSVFTSIAAFQRQIKVGHIEAGLRTYDKRSPFPEEMNRQLTAKLVDYHFAPTLEARDNLQNENIAEQNIIVTGNTVVDALEFSKDRIDEYNIGTISTLLNLPVFVLNKFVLITGHRRENFGNGIRKVCQALNELSSQIPLIYPVHLNPNVESVVYSELKKNNRVYLLKPVAYPHMLWLLKNCEFVISDSGGIQEEAPSFGKKVLVTRKNSERPEGIRSEFATLVGTDKNMILEEANKILNNNSELKTENPYGDGNASEKIVSFLINRCG
jgi:UDP-N-acetylglucosamine 2-epimerase (non-hydrolysing)